MRQQEPTPEVEAAEPNIVDLNVAVRLLDMFARSKHYALAYVDSLGVIERLTSTDAVHKAKEWAYLMRAHDVRPGDPVIVLGDRDREWRFAVLGVMLAGGVAVPCPADTPVAEVQAIAADSGAVLIVSGRARPDLVEHAGPPMLSADNLDRHAATSAGMELVYRSKPGDVALILYRRDAAGLHGVRYTHTALIAQAEDGEHWLGVREGERIWCTAPDGSVPSIWLLLAAWHAGAELVTVDVGLDPGAQLELLDKLRASAVWLTDDEYRVLAPAAAPAWVELESVRRALTSDEPADGAIAFGDAFGAKVAPVYGLAETGVLTGWPFGREVRAAPGTGIPLPGIQLAIVDEQGNELPSGEVGDVRVRGGAPSFFAGYTSAGGPPGANDWFRVGGRGAVEADGRLRLASGSSLELERIEAVAGVAVAAPVEEEASTAVGGAAAAAAAISNVPEAPSGQDGRDAKRAHRRAEQEAKERRKADERRLREEAESRKRAEKAERAEREAAEAEGRRLAEEAKRAEREAAKAEEQRRVEEDKNRRLAERTGAEERRRAEKAEREAAKAEERRRAEEEKRLEQEQDVAGVAVAAPVEEEASTAVGGAAAAAAAISNVPEAPSGQDGRDAKRARRRAEQEAKERRKADERRLREEAESRKRAEKAERAEREAAEAEGRRLAEEAKRAEREAAKAEEQRRVEEDKNRRLAERTAAEERRRAEKAEREAAKAEERRRAEEEKRLEQERRRAEEADREAAKAEERRRAEEEKRLGEVRRREAKLARRSEEQEAKQLQKVEEQRRREEEKNRKATERAERDRLAAEAKARKAEAELLRAEEAERERLEVEAADAETSGERRERIGQEERQRESQIPREAAHAKSDREMDIVSRISQYGMGTQVAERKQREDDADVLETVQPDEQAP